MDEELYGYMKVCLRYGYDLGFLPYKLITVTSTDEETGRVTETQKWVYEKSFFHRFFLYYSYLCVGLYEIFLLCRTLETHWDDEAPVKEKLKTFYLTGTFMIANIFHWVNIKYWGRHCKFYNIVVEAVNMISGIQEGTRRKSEGPTAGKKWGFFKWFRIPLVLVTPCIGLLRARSVFKNPGAKQLVSSLAFVVSPTTPKTDISIWVKILAAGFHFHVTAHLVFQIAYLASTLIWFEAAIAALIKQLRILKGEFRTPLLEEQLYHSYHCLHILQKYGNQMYSSIPLGAELATIFICVINIFIGAVHHEYGVFMRVAAMSLMIRVLFRKFAQIYEESGKAIESWTTKGRICTARNILGCPGQMRQEKRRNAGWFDKFKRSARPLRVSIGGFFYVDNIFFLTLIQIIIGQSTNLIISYRD